MNPGYKITFDQNHIHVQLGPEYVVDKSGESYWKELRAACDQYGSHRVLVEGMVPGGERETSEVVAAGQRTATVPNLWMAFHLENFVPNEKSELYEVIAASRGVRVKFFADRDHAIQWLRSNAPS